MITTTAWVSTGLLVAVGIGFLVDDRRAWVGIAVYVVVNLTGTAALLHYLRASSNRDAIWFGLDVSQWARLAKAAFIVQLPVGLATFIVNGL